MHEVAHLCLNSDWRDDSRSEKPMKGELLRKEETALIEVRALFYQLLNTIGCCYNFRPKFLKMKTTHSPSHPPTPCVF